MDNQNQTGRLPTSVRALLGKALPTTNGETGILALGESHAHSEHIEYIRTNLKKLKNRYRVGTIGIEDSIYLNVFFRAYAENKLPVAHEHARQYIKEISRAHSNDRFHPNRDAVIDLAIDAIDQGIKVVAFDCRLSLTDQTKAMEHWETVFSKRLETFMANHPSLWEGRTDARQALREDAALRKRFFEEQFSVQGETYFWMISEATSLMNQFPDYADYIANMQKLLLALILDNNESQLFSSDFISALFFRACAIPNQNAVTISGLSHIERRAKSDGVIDGKFADHLGDITLAGTANLRVTAAVLAGAGMYQDLTSSRDGHSAIQSSDVAPIQGIIIPAGQRFTLKRPRLEERLKLTIEKNCSIGKIISDLQQPWEQSPMHTR